ncbi:MAG: cysteine desulfurase [Patescibacteria group bacterium]
MINRQDFPMLRKNDLIYFDNAATSLKPEVVISAITDYYSNYGTSVHRGLSPLAESTTLLYEEVRKTVASFIKAKPTEIIFTSGATMSINLVARTWGEANLKKDDVVVLSMAEHHANIVPWLQLKEKIGIQIQYIPLLNNGELDLIAAKKILALETVKLLAVTQASNVLGIVNPIKELIAEAKNKNIVTLIDATLSAAHLSIDVSDLDCDFLVFSAHKILGPTGVGVLYGRLELLNKMPPFLGGGSMISSVAKDNFTAAELPYKFEAGTPNIAGVIGLGEACLYIQNLGWETISSSEKLLTNYFLTAISKLDFVTVLGISDNKLPVFSLILEGIHSHDAADLLGQEGIILRAGHHCAQPLHDYLGITATLRVSLSFYNTTTEIDIFITKLKDLISSFK